jgi:hypothetical protein
VVTPRPVRNAIVLSVGCPSEGSLTRLLFSRIANFLPLGVLANQYQRLN